MKKIVSSLLFFALALSAMAVPAYPDLVVFRQPGNRDITISIYLKGDEKVHWAETEDGYSLLHGDDGCLMYATKDENGDMVATDMIATEKEMRSAEVVEFLSKTPKHLRFSKRQIAELLSIWKQIDDSKKGPKSMSNVLGEKKFLVILFAFNDKEFIYNKMDIKRLFNQVNYSTNGSTGSVHDYYYDVSGGLFSLTVDVVGPYTGTRNMAFYGNTNYGYQVFAREAVDSAAGHVDFSEYDNDNDGFIDGLHIIFAGVGEESGGGSDCIWSHKSYIYDPPIYNNTVVDVYSCSPECQGTSSDLTTIGVICHELGHVFGAPDYYDTDYEESGGQFPGLGNWDVMSSGSYNNGGKRPAHHNPYTKIYIYKWRDCDTLDGSATKIVMDPVEEGGKIYRVNTSTNRDFFLLENRQAVKWDKSLPGHGMLVYHVHPAAHGASVHNYQHPQQIYILAKPGNNNESCPNSSPSSYGILNNEDTPYPGQSGRRDSLTDNSTPWFRPWSGQANNTPLYNISENTSTKQVLFTVQYLSPDPLAATAEGVDRESVVLDWTPYGSMNVMVVMSTEEGAFGVPNGFYLEGDTVDGGGIVIYKGGATSKLVNGLQVGNTYHFRIYSIDRQGRYSDGIDVAGSPIDCDIDEWGTEDFEAQAIDMAPNCWTGTWIVDSLMGQQSLMTRMADSGSVAGWSMISSKPFVIDPISDAVLKFRTHFDGTCNENTTLVTEYRASLSQPWVVLDSLKWHIGMATWKNVFLPMPEAGNYSRIRFSAYTGEGQRIAVDDIEIITGALINADCDANGSIYPSGYIVKPDNDTIDFTIIPISGYGLEAIMLDNRQVMPSLVTSNNDGTYSYRYGTNGGSHTIYAKFERQTGIETVDKSVMVIYPNPSSGTINIEVSQKGKAELYDVRGKRVAAIDLNAGHNTMDLSNMPKGIYIIRHQGNVTKIVKK